MYNDISARERDKKTKGALKEPLYPVQPVILAGGIGSRLWPLSRASHPKQAMTLSGEKSLLQTTWSRYASLLRGNLPILVLSCSEHRYIVFEQVAKIARRPFKIIVQPHDRDTAPAIILSAMFNLRCGNDPVMIFCPSDHIISRPDALLRLITKEAIPMAQDGKIVCLGIPPAYPESGYGYILRGEDRRVLKFVEKPPVEKARAMLKEGNWLWNAGIYILKASTIKEEAGRFAPNIVEIIAQTLEDAYQYGAFVYLEPNKFSELPFISIDKAIMEKTMRLYAIEANIGWQDIGSWRAMWEIGKKDRFNNVIKGDVLSIDCTGSLFYSTKRRISAIGLHDMIVIETQDGILICPKDRAQDVKRLGRL